MLSNKLHFLQTSAWAKFQRSLGKTVIEQSGQDWQFLAIVESSGGFRRLYCPYGPVATSSEALKQALDTLRQTAKAHRAHYIRVQPTGLELKASDLESENLQPIKYSQPVRTWLLDLTPPLEDLYAAMKQNTRNICRNYQKKALSYRMSDNPDDIHLLTNLLHGVASHNQIAVHSDAYFQKQANSLMPIGAAKLHLIEYEDQVIAAALTYQTEDTICYGHAAADYEHRALGASTALVGEIIRYAKSHQIDTLDFFGIAPNDDPGHKQAGLTRFKQSFGGYSRVYPPTSEAAIAPLPYGIYRLIRKIRGLDT